MINYLYGSSYQEAQIIDTQLLQEEFDNFNIIS